MMLLVLFSVIYIAWFSRRVSAKLAPVLRAIPEGGDLPAVRVSVAFIGGVLVYTMAWARVFAAVMEGLYV